MQVYLFCKSYNKLKIKLLLFQADVSDGNNSVNSKDASSTSMTCNNNELLTPLFNTNTGLSVIILPMGYSFVSNL